MRWQSMQARTTRREARGPRYTTLLELLADVNETTPDDASAIARVVALVNSGRVVLTGNFRGTRMLSVA